MFIPVRMNDLAHPKPTAEMKVPRKANVKMVPKLRKKFSCDVEIAISFDGDFGGRPLELACFSSYPELRMMGGSKRLKKRVCLKDYM